LIHLFIIIIIKSGEIDSVYTPKKNLTTKKTDLLNPLLSNDILSGVGGGTSELSNSISINRAIIDSRLQGKNIANIEIFKTYG
jgi:hypothetical protein